MKTPGQQNAKVPQLKSQSSTAAREEEIIFHLPLGAKLSDVYMDGSQVAIEMHISKGSVHNYRNSGKLPFSLFFGKYYYNRQLIAAMLAEAQQFIKKPLNGK